MNAYTELDYLCSFTDDLKNRDKILKTLKKLKDLLENQDVCNWKKDWPNNSEIIWDKVCKLLIRMGNWFLQTVKDKSVTEWKHIAANKNIIDLTSFLLKSVLSYGIEGNIAIDINDILDLIGRVTETYSSSEFSICIGFLKILLLDYEKLSSTIVISADPQTWMDIESRLCQSLLKINNFEEQHLLLLTALWRVYKLMGHKTVPDIVKGLRVLDHLSNAEGQIKSIKACGYIATIFNNFAEIYNFGCSVKLIKLGIHLSQKVFIKAWQDIRLKHMIIDESYDVTFVCPYSELLAAWRHMYALLVNNFHVSEEDSSVSSWLKSVSMSLCDVISYLKKRATLIDHKALPLGDDFFKFTVALVTQVKYGISDNEKRDLRRYVSVTTIVDEIIHGDSTRQLLWLAMFRAALDDDNYRSTIVSSYQQVVDALNLCLDRPDTKEAVVVNIFQILNQLIPSMDRNMCDVSVISNTVLGRYLKSPQCSLACGFLRNILINELGSLYLLDLHDIFATTITDAALDLVTQVILYIPSFIPVRQLAPIEFYRNMLSLLIFGNLDNVSFQSYYSCINALIVRKCLKSKCYNVRHYIIDDLVYHNDYEPVLEDSVRLFNLQQPQSSSKCPTEGLIVSMNYSSLSQRNKQLLSVFLELSSDCQLPIITLVRLSFLIEMIKYEGTGVGSTDIMKLTDLVLGHLKEQTVSQSFLNGLRYIAWSELNTKYNDTEDEAMKQSIIKLFRIVEEFLSSSLQNVDTIKDFPLILITYLAFKHQIDFFENLSTVISDVLRHLNFHKLTNVNTLDYIIQGLLRFKVSMPESFYSQLLSMIKEGFRIYRRDLKMFSLFINVASNVVKLIEHEPFVIDVKRRIIDFLYNLNTIVYQVIEKNFPKEKQLNHIVVKQKATLFCYYWKHDIDFYRVKLREIRDALYYDGLLSKLSSFQDTWAYYFVELISDMLDESQLVAVLEELIINLPFKTFDCLFMKNDDVNVSRYITSSFLRIWVRCPIYMLEGSVLPFIDKVLPNGPVKCEFIAKFIASFHSRKLSLHKIISSKFLCKLIEIQQSSNSTIILPNGYDFKSLIRSNFLDIYWHYSMENKWDVMASYVAFEDWETVVREGFPQLIARSVVRSIIDRGDNVMFELSILIGEVKHNLLEIYGSLVKYLSIQEACDIVALFTQSVTLVHESFELSEGNFNAWLRRKPGNLMSLVVNIIRQFEVDKWEASSRMWRYLMKILMSLEGYWSKANKTTDVDGSISFLILRHLTILRAAIMSGKFVEDLSLLSELVLFANDVITDYDCPLHTIWHNQVFYLCSLFWDRLKDRHTDLVNIIIKPLTVVSKWSVCLSHLDRYLLSMPGFSNLDSILLIFHEPVLLDSLNNFLYCFKKFNITYFLYHGKYFATLANILRNLSASDCVNGDLQRALQRFNYVLCNFLTLSSDSGLSLSKENVNSDVLSCIMYLRVILLPLTFGEECNLLTDNESNQFLSRIFTLCVTKFGDDAWRSYQFLASIVMDNYDSYLACFCNIFSSEGPCIGDKVIIDNTIDYCLFIFVKLVWENYDRIFTNDFYDVSCLADQMVPYLRDFRSGNLTKLNKESVVMKVNDIFLQSDLYSTDNCKILIQLMLSMHTLDLVKDLTIDFDFLAAAKVSHEVGMHTATLLLLERMWLTRPEMVIESAVVNLYKDCYQVLGCGEELLDERFCNYSDQEPDSFKWLFRHGQFDILKQLLAKDSFKEDAIVNHQRKIDVLWRLSRWDDEESYEINKLKSNHDENLLMYDAVYSKTEHVINQYKVDVSKRCLSGWDSEECLQSLVELVTIGRSEESLERSLSSLMYIANKSNMDQLDSSFTYNVVSMARVENGKSIIARNSMKICDMAVRFSRLDYIDLVADIFKMTVTDYGKLSCDGNNACLRMVLVLKYWNSEDRRRCNPELQKLIDDCNDHLSSCTLSEHGLLKQLYCQAISKLCSWNRIYPVYSANHIRLKFLDPAFKLFENDSVIDTDLLNTMATFSYQQYHSHDQYMQSMECTTRYKMLREFQRNLDELDDNDCNSRFKRILQRQSSCEKVDLSSLNNDRNMFLISAVTSCIQCLIQSDQHDVKVFNLVSMWLNNCDRDVLNRLISDCHNKIPSYKYLVLFPQLCARLNSDHKTLFQKTLNKLIEKILYDHPYHSLYNIFAIRNANCDPSSQSLSLSKKPRTDDKMDGRINASTIIIENLLKRDRGIIVKDVDILTKAYIQLANADISNSDKKLQKNIPIPSAWTIKSIGKNINLPNPMVHIPIDKSCRYPEEKLVKILKFETTYFLIGGINLPKVISCLCSDGVSRRQLVKGKDDLRQDSVMQQVFSIVNSLMTGANLWTNCCQSIRTYKVVPTSKLSGVLQWCEGTVPLGDWLADDKTGAHIRYRPNDWSPSLCKSKLFEVKDKSLSVKLERFGEIYDRIKPVFGYFLLENFPDPRQWFKARKAYTESVANNSITGFILGLGDRHVQNILLDLKTAELIHIDLGIAFDQGRLLPTPEMVPFRLTRDLVHAMGPFGVEGRFKATCCNILSELRAQKDIILTLIEVLLYDPLHAWCLSAQQNHSLQVKRMSRGDITINGVATEIMDESENITKDNRQQNQMAERVILELSRKLSGNVDNCNLNVDGHVNTLIQRAMDPENLARMFCGWQAYL